MPDVIMCQNQTCKFNKECYRYMATPKKNQSYADYAPGKKTCADRIPYTILPSNEYVPKPDRSKPGKKKDTKGRSINKAQQFYRQQSFAKQQARKQRKGSK